MMAAHSAPADIPSAPDESWIARLRLIPDDCREFSVDLKRAKLEFGVDDLLAQRLITLGIPYANAHGSPRFAAADLHYIGLRLGCATTYLEVMRLWAAALTVSAMCDWVEVEIRCVPYATPGTRVQILGPRGTATAVIGPDRTAANFGISIPGQWPTLDPALGDLLSDIASLDFCWIPEPVGADIDFARRTRLADCASASKLLVEECHARGIEARTAYGLLLALPYSTPHNWAEIRTGDDWIPADPLLLALLVEYADLDATAWPPSRCPGGVLLRLADRATPIVLAGEQPLGATFLTKIHQGPVANSAPRARGGVS
jgi:hypothetical protein